MIKTVSSGTTLTFIVQGRLDAETSPELDSEIDKVGVIVNEIIFDLAELESIASMGLRSILTAYKKMKERGGRISVRNIPPQARSVFEITGFLKTFERDEQLVIMEKSRENGTAHLSLIGTVDKTTAYKFEREVKALKRENVWSLSFDCEKLSQMSPEGSVSLQNIHKAFGGSVTMLNACEDVKTVVKEVGLDFLLAPEPPVSEEPIVPVVLDESEIMSYKCKRAWELDAMPFASPDWFSNNKKIKKITIDFSAITDPAEASEVNDKVTKYRTVAEENNVFFEAVGLKRFGIGKRS